MKYEEQQIKHLSWGLADRCLKCDKIVNNKDQLCLEHKRQSCPRCGKTVIKIIEGQCSQCYSKSKKKKYEW